MNGDGGTSVQGRNDPEGAAEAQRDTMLLNRHAEDWHGGDC